eukprot:s10021_g3.t1
MACTSVFQQLLSFDLGTRNGTVPLPFRGFMAKRRGVSEVVVPELPDEPLRDILQVPDRRNARGRMRQPDEWKVGKWGKGCAKAAMFHLPGCV